MSKTTSYPLQPEQPEPKTLSDALLGLPETASLFPQQLEQVHNSEDLNALLNNLLGPALMQNLEAETLLPAVEDMLKQLHLPSLAESQIQK